MNNNNIRFFPIFSVATILALEEAIEGQVDEIVIGNVFDDVAFGAINLIQPYMTVVNYISYLICVGGAALIVRAHGANDSRKMSEIFSHCISCCLLAGILFFVIYMLFSTQFVNMVALGTEQYEFCVQVFFWQCFYASVFPLCVFLQTYVLYRGAYLLVGFTTLFCIICNPILSLILGRMIGIGGVMLATVIINILEIMIMSTFLFSSRHGLSFSLKIDPRLAGQIFILGLGESSIFLSAAILEASVNAAAVTRYQTHGLVVIAIIINLLELVMYVSEGISEFETVSLNEYLGRDDPDMIHSAIRTTIKAAVIEGIGFSVLFLFGPEHIASVFDIEDVETTAAVIESIRIISIVPVVICMTRIIAIFYQYTARIKRTIALFISAWGVLPAVFAWVIGSISVEWMVAGLVCGNALALGSLYIYVKKIRKEEIFQW